MRQVLLVALFVLVPVASQGGPYDDYKTLTRDEKRLVLRYFWQVPGVRGAAELARVESERAFPQLSGQDDPRDAYRHALWNASMVRRLGSREAAERWGTAHESDPANPAARKAMDLFNNERGREAAWTRRQVSGPLWARRTSFPDDGALGGVVMDDLRRGDLRVIEEVGGRRDPQRGRLVPSYIP
ncbi:MAG: hypothetical protein KIT58_22845 [Planctomycetota bacterium]|nr:hypothetical protein [Planctomycetota bacterium]